jgi:hypothetical protein
MRGVEGLLKAAKVPCSTGVVEMRGVGDFIG